MLSIIQYNKKLMTESYRFISILMLLMILNGCGTIYYQTGRSFIPDRLETVLEPGKSSTLKIKEVLGEPFGKGQALMPFHESPRIVWTYFIDQGSYNLNSGDVEEKRKYLYLFIYEDKYEGYMWFGSQLTSKM